jgi:hypothetical protein
MHPWGFSINYGRFWMDTRKVHVQIVRWLAGLGLILFGLFELNVALYNWWASWGPPTPHPEIYAWRSKIVFLISLASIAGGLFTLYWLRKGRTPPSRLPKA